MCAALAVCPDRAKRLERTGGNFSTYLSCRVRLIARWTAFSAPPLRPICQAVSRQTSKARSSRSEARKPPRFNNKKWSERRVVCDGGSALKGAGVIGRDDACEAWMESEARKRKKSEKKVEKERELHLSNEIIYRESKHDLL